jgi:hypothetical protein
MSGKSDKWGGTRFVYITNLKKTGPITAAFRYNDQKQVIEFEFARCGKADVFSKAIGRVVSHGRLQAHPQEIPYEVVAVEAPLTYQDTIKEVVERVVAQKGKQRRFPPAA